MTGPRLRSSRKIKVNVDNEDEGISAESQLLDKCGKCELPIPEDCSVLGPM